MLIAQIALTVLVVALLPFCFTRPWIGVLVFAWLGYMNPHRLVGGFAGNLPFGKLVAGAMVQDVAAYALDLQGAAGVLSGPEDAEAAGKFQAMLLRAPGTRVEGGTDEIMRNIIAERVLGLPGDIRVDKDVPFNKIPTKGRT